jgi:hypothetical protein
MKGGREGLPKAEANMSAKKNEAPFMAGLWVSKKVTGTVQLYASFDAKAQFMTQKGIKTGVNTRIRMEDGSEQEVSDIMDAKPETVRIYWPSRKMEKGWLYTVK